MMNDLTKNTGGDPPNKPKTPAKPDENPDPTKRSPGGNEPEKNDPTRIEEPEKIDPTRIDEPEPKPNEPVKNPVKNIVGEEDFF